MIERIARRAGGFASTTALRWLGSLGDSVPDVQLPTRKPSLAERVTAPLTKGVVGKSVAKGALAGAVALISSNKTVRRGLANGLDKIADSLGPGSSSSGSGSRSGSSPTSSNGHSGNGSNSSIAQKTRTELYELAKKMDLPGRSSMTKEELEKALKIK